MSKKQLQLGVERIEIKSFSMTNEVLNFTPKDANTIEFSFSVSAPDERGRLRFRLDLVVDKEKSGSYSRLADLKTITHFFVKDHEQFVVVGPNDLKQVEGGLVQILMEMCMHQARGIWAAKTENTPLEHVVLPLLNAEALIGNIKQRPE